MGGEEGGTVTQKLIAKEYDLQHTFPRLSVTRSGTRKYALYFAITPILNNVAVAGEKNKTQQSENKRTRQKGLGWPRFVFTPSSATLSMGVGDSQTRARFDSHGNGVRRADG